MKAARPELYPTGMTVRQLVIRENVEDSSNATAPDIGRSRTANQTSVRGTVNAGPKLCNLSAHGDLDRAVNFRYLACIARS